MAEPLSPPPAAEAPPAPSWRVKQHAVVVVRRFVVLAALMFWQGGFTFYAAIVVPIGGDVLGAPSEQARVTRLVAPILNISGAISLAIFAWDIAAARWRRVLTWGRCLTVIGMAICLLILFLVYPQLNQMFHGPEAYLDPADRAAFRPWHRIYLWVSAVQWGFALLFALLTLVNWRLEDRYRMPPAKPARVNKQKPR